MAGARLGRPKKGGAKDIDVKDVDGLPALLQKEVPYHEPNRSPHGGTALSAYPPARLLQPQQSLSTARSLIWQVAMRRPGASAEYQYCLVLERADFTKLLLPSADRTFEEEMASREKATAV